MKNLLMFCYGAFAIGTLLSLAITGRWLSVSDVNILNTFTQMQGTIVKSLGGVPVIGPLISFFTGIFSMILWNYDYLDNTWGWIFKFIFLYPISFGVIYGLVELFQGMWQGIAGFVRNLIP